MCVWETIFSFSLDILEIPTMLFFFLQAMMSVLRAKTSQMSCRKHVETRKMRIIWHRTFPHTPAYHFNACCGVISRAQLWRAQPSLTRRGWSWTRFLWSRLWIPLWSLDEHKGFCLGYNIVSWYSQNMPFFSNGEGRQQMPIESQRSHQIGSENKAHHADAPRAWTSLKRFPGRTQWGAAEPCCSWSPLNGTQHELTLMKN